MSNVAHARWPLSSAIRSWRIFDRDVMQAAPLAVHRDGVIRRIGHAVGLVVADHEPRFAFQQRHQQMGKARIAVVEHAGMPRPRHAHEDRREAVHRDQRRRPAGLAPPVKLGFDPIMVWPENLPHARGLLMLAQTHVSRYRGELADLRDRGLRTRRAVAVDDQARIVLLHDGGIQRIRQMGGDAGDADVPGDVAHGFGFRNAESTERTRHGMARVIRDNQEIRGAAFVAHGDGSRLVACQEQARGVIHRHSHCRRLEGAARRNWRGKMLVETDVTRLQDREPLLLPRS